MKLGSTPNDMMQNLETIFTLTLIPTLDCKSRRSRLGTSVNTSISDCLSGASQVWYPVPSDETYLRRIHVFVSGYVVGMHSAVLRLQKPTQQHRCLDSSACICVWSAIRDFRHHHWTQSSIPEGTCRSAGSCVFHILDGDRRRSCTWNCALTGLERSLHGLDICRIVLWSVPCRLCCARLLQTFYRRRSACSGRC
jgi:hypothetical protein